MDAAMEPVQVHFDSEIRSHGKAGCCGTFPTAVLGRGDLGFPLRNDDPDLVVLMGSDPAKQLHVGITTVAMTAPTGIPVAEFSFILYMRERSRRSPNGCRSLRQQVPPRT